MPQQSATVDATWAHLKPGTRILHNRFGAGTIEAVEGTGDNCKMVVNFDNVGVKPLLLKFAKFTIL